MHEGQTEKGFSEEILWAAFLWIRRCEVAERFLLRTLERMQRICVVLSLSFLEGSLKGRHCGPESWFFRSSCFKSEI